ncbi:hypothetical protein MNBD_GAMMA03-3 [hydrothermal vent metagenome]|uniref:Sulfotransferase domain-containing protein n=1 Tax=hydrothermal vent metagenome TaxID=652676 RepID=A0A3B0W076_9ZZZZ
MSQKKNILITGIPRSGTSLITKLISLDKNNICFSEPTFIKEIKAISENKKEILANLNQKIIGIRDCIKNGKSLEFRVGKDGQIPDNYFTIEYNNITRNKSSKFKNIILPKDYSQNTIFIKNNLLFTSCIEELSKQYEIIAIIRNPISIINSWKSLNLPISKGVVISGIKYSTSLKNISNEKGLLIKQIKIIDWFYNKYLENNVNLIKYEDLVENSCMILNRWIDDIVTLPKLNSKNMAERNSCIYEISTIIKRYSKLYGHEYCNLLA